MTTSRGFIAIGEPQRPTPASAAALQGKIFVMSRRGIMIGAALPVVAIGAPLSLMIQSGLAEGKPLAAPVTREFAAAGGTRAVFLYQEDVPTHRMNLRIRIERRGRSVVAERVPPIRRAGRSHPAAPGGGEHPSLHARDLDADGEPEVFLNLYWGGPHCCWWTRIYAYSKTREAYAARNHWWGEARAYYGFRGSLRDLDGDRRPEFSGRDDRFMELSYFAVDPIRIWSYRSGLMYDVTRRHPRQVVRDAKGLWRFYPEARRERWVRELLAAWAADQYLLGRRELAEQILIRAAQRGELTGKPHEHPRGGRAWIAVLKRFLRKTGYIGS